MGITASSINTDQVAAAERVGFWTECIARLFSGLRSDLYGDTDFDGRMSTLHAGDVVLTRLEANRHRVLRSAALARSGETGYLKIVAPYVGCAGVEQQGREAWVTPGQWSLYDTTASYAVANPVRVEHLIVMLPKQSLVERGISLDPLLARRLGGSGGVARMALETMRSAYRELPGMSEVAARGVGDAITQFVHLSMLELAGIGTAATQREALRERIKQHVSAHLGDPALAVDAIALALNCSRRQLYNAFAEEPDGVAGYILRCRLEACRKSFDDRANDRRSITDIAFSFGFSSMAHFSRVFRAHLGVAPSDYRHGVVAGALPG
ncbi:helix-turn-helix domain-containing protein [Rivibacter subsaxonicus]|uniref:AraC family transcriptional regulator n=1 Tax=Rivibacter subsaxonicus TaxID=457575 RepID=A0A4Q7VW42_9BURK|nr:helix-turn-helix domain-containing protein [Rivibacter subsaxonicus]RZU00924.1 AraC family transcriptional regulator [Rivibacter subsaxonicus]